MKRSKTFFSAFTISLCVLGLGAGLFVVGYNSRRMAQGDAAPTGSYGVEKGRFTLIDGNGNQMTLAVIEEAEDTTALLPAPARVTLHVLRGITAGLHAMAERLMN